MTASYLVFVRDSTNNLIGQIDDYETLTLNPKFCAVGAWAMTLDLHSPKAALFTPGSGIEVFRKVPGGSWSVYFSGPLGSYHLAGSASGDTLTVGGPDDMTVLADRLALPAHGYPYGSLIQAAVPVRYYRLQNTLDSSGNGATLTVSGGVSNASGLIDDPDLSARFDGSTGFMSSGNATGLPTGANPITLECWCYLTAMPAASSALVAVGNKAVAGAFLDLEVDASAHPVLSTSSKVVFGSPLALNTVHHMVGIYDGVTMTLYVDGVSVGTPQTITLALAYPSTNKLCIGANTASTTGQFFSGIIDEVAIYSGAQPAGLVTQHYNTGISRFGSSASEQSGYGLSGTGLWAYVDNNVGPDAGGVGNGDSARVVASLSIGGTPTTVGTNISASARFDNLLALCQSMAVAGGDIGFAVLQSGTSLVLSIYTPADKTSNAMFARTLGNLLDYDYELLRAKANYAYVLGGGQGTARVVQEVNDTSSITSWGRIEGSVDARDTSDYNTLAARGAAYLDQNKSQTNFSCVAIDTDSLTYGRDYGLGDKVRVWLPDGTLISDIVREVLVTLNRQGGEDIKVGIGNPGNGAVLTPANAALKSVLSSHVGLVTDVRQLQRRY